MDKIKENVSNLKIQIGKRARELRKRAGFSSADSAAEAMEVSNTAVYELERGDNWVSPEMIVLMQKHYQVKNPAAFFSSDPIQISATKEEALEIIAKALEKPTLSAVPAPDPFATLNADQRRRLNGFIDRLKSEKLPDSVKSSIRGKDGI